MRVGNEPLLEVDRQLVLLDLSGPADQFGNFGFLEHHR
jgi:hypothetical protein